jgi:NADPH:quinone reductase-like Zn-dependent oxidoreductase
MKKIIVKKFGGVDELQLLELPTPEPAAGEVRVKLTSIGMNHAELMARRGEYRLSSGEPPFTPGLEGGGIVDAAGPDLPADEWIGRRVILSAAAPRRAPGGGGMDGTYTTHVITTPDNLLPAPDNLPDDQLGTLWLAYLTAWGCLVWKQQIRPGQFVCIPAASSSVGLAAGQIVKQAGATAIGLTTSEGKAQALAAMPENAFDHIIITNEPDRKMRRWHKDVQKITGENGVDVYFDPVAAGEYLNLEIRSLAMNGTIWVYGLLGTAGPVDVSPLIWKHGAIRGWVLSELYAGETGAAQRGYDEILSGVAAGIYKMPIAERFKLEDVQHAHTEMEKGRHIGKMVLVP